MALEGDRRKGRGTENDEGVKRQHAALSLGIAS